MKYVIFRIEVNEMKLLGDLTLSGLERSFEIDEQLFVKFYYKQHDDIKDIDTI